MPVVVREECGGAEICTVDSVGNRLASLFFTRGGLVYFSPDLLSHCQHLNQADMAQFVIILLFS